MTQRFRVDSRRCQGCLSCLTVCSMTKEGVNAPSRARLRVELDPFGGQNRVIACLQCRRAPCAKACPESAIQLTAGNYWVIDYEMCTGCRQCVDACPLGALFADPSTGKVFKCDTCDGDPACADICPTGALRWGNGEEARK